MAQQTNAEGINTGISWTTYTLNLWWGCTKVHAGCDNCYAEKEAHRWGNDVWGNDKPRRLIAGWESTLNKYQREAAAAGEIRTCFVGSMMDIFEKPMPLANKEGKPAVDWSDGSLVTTDWPRRKLFEAISAGSYPNLLFLMLTKRPSNINKYIPQEWKNNGAPANVMFGTSPVDQQTADTLIPQLLQVKGRRFLSCEPLLGPIDLRKVPGFNKSGQEGADLIRGLWVIAGGESGHGARPMHPDWARSLRNQCANARVKFHFKQWGEWIPMSQATHPVDLEDGETYKIELKFPDSGILKQDGETFIRSGKKANGRRLDGKEYNALATD